MLSYMPGEIAYYTVYLYRRGMYCANCLLLIT